MRNSAPCRPLTFADLMMQWAAGHPPEGCPPDERVFQTLNPCGRPLDLGFDLWFLTLPRLLTLTLTFVFDLDFDFVFDLTVASCFCTFLQVARVNGRFSGRTMAARSVSWLCGKCAGAVGVFPGARRPGPAQAT